MDPNDTEHHHRNNQTTTWILNRCKQVGPCRHGGGLPKRCVLTFTVRQLGSMDYRATPTSMYISFGRNHRQGFLITVLTKQRSATVPSKGVSESPIQGYTDKSCKILPPLPQQSQTTWIQTMRPAGTQADHKPHRSKQCEQSITAFRISPCTHTLDLYSKRGGVDLGRKQKSQTT